MKPKFLDTNTLLGKVLIILLAGITLVIVCFLFFINTSEWLWPEFNGSYNLGNGIYMIEWDGGGKLIVKGSNIKGNTCYGGEYIIPTYENSYDNNGHFAEYVVDAKSNNNWIIAKTDNKQKQQAKYYIINKTEGIEQLNIDEIVEQYVLSFTDSVEFAHVCQRKGIPLKW